MPVYTKSYIGLEGTYSINDPELAFARILDLSREGTDYSQVDIGSVPTDANTFSYNSNTGQISFGQPFSAAGERVEIIYDGGTPAPVPPTPPLTCDPVASATASVTGSVITVMLPVVGNYNIDIIPAAGTCGDAPSASGVVTGGNSFTAPALADGTYKACVTTNCGGGLLSTPVASNSVTITTPPANFGARKEVLETGKKLISITGFAYTIRSGSLPLVAGGSTISARHEGFTAAIQVVVSVVNSQKTVLGLYKNAALVESRDVFRLGSGNVTTTFGSISALSTDDVFIQMDYT